MPEHECVSFDALCEYLALDEQIVTLPGWPGPVAVRPLAVGEVMEIARAVKAAGGDEERATKLMIARCLVRPAVTDAQVEVLWARNFALLKPLIERLQALNGMGAEAGAVARDGFRPPA